MKERILIAIRDEKVLEESASILNDHDYIVTRVSNLSDMELQINAMPQDLILLESILWIKERPDFLNGLEQNYPESSIIHLIPNDDQEGLDLLSRNGTKNFIFEPVTAKEILVMVNQGIRYKNLMQRYQQMRNEFREANKELSIKAKEFQKLLAFNTNILESINLGIMTVDTNLKITSWNSKISDITGIDKSAALDSGLFQTMPWLNMENISERVNSVITNGETTELGHLKGKKQDGLDIYGDYKISPIKKGDETLGAVITVDDITRKVNFKDEMEGSQKYIGNMVEYAADAIVSYDLDGIIVTWNRGAQEIFGYNSQEAIGHSWDLTASENDRKRIFNMIQFVKKSGSVSNFEAQMRHKSGRYISVSMGISLIKDAEGKIYGISAIFKDVSEGKRFNRQLIHSQKILSFRELVCGMLQNINTPLSSLSSNTTLLLNRAQKNNLSDITANMQKIGADADKIAQLAKDILWYGKPAENGTEEADIHDILDKSLTFTRFQTKRQNIKIENEHKAQNTRIMGNSRELVQAFINILKNAEAAMPDGGIIKIRTENIKDTEILDRQECLSIKITDTGIGIPSENISKIFEQFFTTKPEGQGNGLGLYVAQSIVENHYGRIEVESKVNKGTCFTILLPSQTEPEKEKA